jgi:hypothetical protein
MRHERPGQRTDDEYRNEVHREDAQGGRKRIPGRGERHQNVSQREGHVAMRQEQDHVHAD